MEIRKPAEILSEDEQQDMIVRERLCAISERIEDQFEHISEGMDFFERNQSKFLPNSDFGPILMAYDLLACGPILSELFSDIQFDGDLEIFISKLERLGEKEINARWKKFLQIARDLTQQARESHMTDTASWIIGQDTSPYPAPHDPDVAKPDPELLEKTIPQNLESLAMFIIKERVGKIIEEQYEAEWLANDREPTEIDPSVDQGQVERLFGAVGPDALYALLPRELQGAIAKIKLIAPERSKIITAHGEEHQYEFHGRFDRDDATMQFVISPEQTIETILETWFHELGHAIITGSTPIDREIRMQYAQAVARSGKLQNGYASGIYDTEGIERGLEEDFAESIRQFFIYRQEFAQDEPNRSEAISKIMQKYCPSFNHRDLARKIYIFMQNTQSSKAT